MHFQAKSEFEIHVLFI